MGAGTKWCLVARASDTTHDPAHCNRAGMHFSIREISLVHKQSIVTRCCHQRELCSRNLSVGPLPAAYILACSPMIPQTSRQAPVALVAFVSFNFLSVDFSLTLRGETRNGKPGPLLGVGKPQEFSSARFVEAMQTCFLYT